MSGTVVGMNPGRSPGTKAENGYVENHLRGFFLVVFLNFVPFNQRLVSSLRGLRKQIVVYVDTATYK